MRGSSWIGVACWSRTNLYNASIDAVPRIRVSCSAEVVLIWMQRSFSSGSDEAHFTTGRYDGLVCECRRALQSSTLRAAARCQAADLYEGTSFAWLRALWGPTYGICSLSLQGTRGSHGDAIQRPGVCVCVSVCLSVCLSVYDRDPTQVSFASAVLDVHER